jgi:hypothetical protein
MATEKVWYSKGETIAGPKGSYESTRIDYGEEETVEPGETREEAYQRCKRNVLEVVERDAAEIRRQMRGGR